MNTFGLMLAGALFAPAQQDPVQVNTGTLTLTLAGQVTPPRTAVDEQIEVMRALLLRRLRGSAAGSPLHDATATASYLDSFNAFTTGNTAYQPTTIYQPQTAPDGTSFYQPATTFAPWLVSGTTAARAGSDGQAVEGVYLPGYGALFSVTLPAPAQDPRPSAGPKPAPAEVTEWERMRRALHGEATPEPAPAAPKEPPLGDVLLRLLAENGRHLTALNDDERLTVVVTFRGHRPSTRSTLTAPANANTTATNPLGAGLSGTLTPFGGGSVTTTTAHGQTARDHELLGDLHLKQGQNQQALEAFSKALAALDAEWKKTDLSRDEDQAIRQMQQRLADLYTKQAQAQLAAGRSDEARQLLDKAKAAKEQAGKAADKAPVTAKPGGGPALPARLTVSAPKRLLDQVGTGKISFEEFRKEAKVEYQPAAGAPAPSRKATR
jgi:hypothetical protein